MRLKLRALRELTYTNDAKLPDRVHVRVFSPLPKGLKECVASLGISVYIAWGTVYDVHLDVRNWLA